MLPCQHIPKQLLYPHFCLCTLTLCSGNGNSSHPQWFPAHHRARNHGECGTIWPNSWPVPNTLDRVEVLESPAHAIWLAVLEAWRAWNYLRLWLNGWLALNALDEKQDNMQVHALISYLPFLFLPAYQQTQTPLLLAPTVHQALLCKVNQLLQQLGLPPFAFRIMHRNSVALYLKFLFNCSAGYIVPLHFIHSKGLTPLASSITFAHHPQCIRKTFSAFFA